MSGRKRVRIDEELTGKERKKQKTAIARAIDVQNASSSVPNSMTGLPSAVDVEKFVEARAFEIKAMDDAMKSARANATQRVWQTLPRHLRRRAASHDVRRVPVRLRVKARIELEGVKRKGSGKPKLPRRGKSKRISRTETLLRRQRDKTWLETHIWHSKRMKMKNLWGYRLSVQPTEKAFRPSHRASVNGSIIHDASYYSLIEVTGNMEVLKAMLKLCSDPMGLSVSAARYTSGARAFESFIYHSCTYPVGLIGPATFLWKPEIIPEKSEKSKGPQQSKRLSSSAPPTHSLRTLWIRFHPAMFDQVQQALQESAARTLDGLRKSNDKPELQEPIEEIEIVDLRGEVNAFEIVGPKSTAVVKGVLDLVKAENARETQDAWEKLKHVQTTGALSRGLVLGLKVHDPRLSFPPKNTNPVHGQGELQSVLVNPNPRLAQSEIWSEKKRAEIRNKKFKKSELDWRRQKLPVPGTRLNPTALDDRVPVILIQNTISPHPEASAIDLTARSRTNSPPLMHGWTLLVPAGWSMPFFTSLVHTGTRVAGLRERHAQHFEASATSSARYYPDDYVTTEAYDQVATGKGSEDRAKWERTPPAKRFNFGLLNGSNGSGPHVWKPDWNTLVGLPRTHDVDETQSSFGADVDDREFIPTQPLPSEMDVDSTVDDDQPKDPKIEQDIKVQPSPHPWLLRGSDVATIVGILVSFDDQEHVQQSLYDQIVGLRRKRGLPENFGTSAESLYTTALVGVNVEVLFRGSLERLSVIYRLDREEMERAHQNVQSRDESHEKTIPPSTSIIGFVTTGNFSLSRGKSHAVGTVTLASLVDLLRSSRKSNLDKCMVKIRNRDEMTCHYALLEVMG